MKTKIKRHSRSVLSVILAISMLISCMMVGLIATDAAKSQDESIGWNIKDKIEDAKVYGNFNYDSPNIQSSWTYNQMNKDSTNHWWATFILKASTTFDFKLQSKEDGNWKYRGANGSDFTFTSSNTVYNEPVDSNDKNFHVTTKSSSSGYVSVSFDYWGEHSNQCKLFVNQQDVSNFYIHDGSTDQGATTITGTQMTNSSGTYTATLSKNTDHFLMFNASSAASKMELATYAKVLSNKITLDAGGSAGSGDYAGYTEITKDWSQIKIVKVRCNTKDISVAFHPSTGKVEFDTVTTIADTYYLGGRLTIKDSNGDPVYSGDNVGSWSDPSNPSTNKIEFIKVSNTDFKVDTYCTISELSDLSRHNNKEPLFIVHDGTDVYATSDSNGMHFENATESHKVDITDFSGSLQKANEFMFDDFESNSDGKITIHYDPTNEKIWYTIADETLPLAESVVLKAYDKDNAEVSGVVVGDKVKLTATVTSPHANASQLTYRFYNTITGQQIGQDITTNDLTASVEYTEDRVRTDTFKVVVSTQGTDSTHGNKTLREVFDKVDVKYANKPIYRTDENLNGSTAALCNKDNWLNTPISDSTDHHFDVTLQPNTSYEFSIATACPKTTTDTTTLENNRVEDFYVDQKLTKYCNVEKYTLTVTYTNDQGGTETYAVRTYKVTTYTDCTNPTIHINTNAVAVTGANGEVNYYPGSIYAVATYTEQATQTKSSEETVTYYFAEAVGDEAQSDNTASVSNAGMSIVYWNNSLDNVRPEGSDWATEIGKLPTSQLVPVSTPVNVSGSNKIYVDMRKLYEAKAGNESGKEYKQFKIYSVQLPVWATSFGFMETNQLKDGKIDKDKIIKTKSWNDDKEYDYSSILLNPNRVYLLYKNSSTWYSKGVVLDSGLWSSTTKNNVGTKTFKSNAVNYNIDYKDNSVSNDFNKWLSSRVYNNYQNDRALYFGYFDPASTSASTNLNDFKITNNLAMRARTASDYHASIQGLVAEKLDTDNVNSNGFPLLETYTDTARHNKVNMPLFDYSALATDKSRGSDTLIKSQYLGVDFPMYESSFNGITTYSYDSSTDPNRAIDGTSKNFVIDNTWRKAAEYLAYMPFAKTDDGDWYGTATELDVEFFMSNTGNLRSKDGTTTQDITFNFSGDDDVWVYVDGVLVLDLGGAHMASAGTINFTDMKVYYKTAAKDEAAAGAVDSATWPHETGSVKTVNLQHVLAANGVNFNNKDGNTKHTFQMFYLERGAIDSNMSVSFNLPQASGLNIANKVSANNVNPGLVNAAMLAANSDYFTYGISAQLGDSTMYSNTTAAYSGAAKNSYATSAINAEKGPNYPSSTQTDRVFSTSIAKDGNPQTINKHYALSRTNDNSAEGAQYSQTGSLTPLNGVTYSLSDKYLQPVNPSDTNLDVTGKTDDEGHFHLLGDQSANFEDKVTPHSYVSVYQDQLLGKVNESTAPIGYQSVTENYTGNYYVTSYSIYDDHSSTMIVPKTEPVFRDQINKSHLYASDSSENTNMFYFSDYGKTATSAAMTVTFYNDIAVGDIKISKAYDGDAKTTFYFDLLFANIFGSDDDTFSSLVAYNLLTYDVIQADGQIRRDVPYGTAGIAIKAGETAVIKGVPVETRYKVVERTKNGTMLTGINKYVQGPDGAALAHPIPNHNYAENFTQAYIKQNNINSTSNESIIDEHGDTYYVNMIPIVQESLKEGEYRTTSFVEFTNTKSDIKIVFHYYDRNMQSDKPASISTTPTAYTVYGSLPDTIRDITGDNAAIKNALKTMIGSAAVEFESSSAATKNVIDDYAMWTSQAEAEVGIGSQIDVYNGGKTYNEYAGPDYNKQKQFHTNALGQLFTGEQLNEAGYAERWVNYKNGSDYVEAEAYDNGEAALAIKEVNVWLHNNLHPYTVNIYGVKQQSDLTAPRTVELNGKNISVCVAGTNTTEGTSKLTNQKVYYNQRLGKKLDNDSVDTSGFLTSYDKLGYVKDIEPYNYLSRDTFTVGNKQYRFAYWAYDPQGKIVASTNAYYYYRITRDTDLYAVYAEAQLVEQTDAGLSIYNNRNDTYVDKGGKSRTRLNVIINPYACPDSDDWIRQTGLVYVNLSKKVEGYTDSEIISLFNSYRGQLDDILKDHPQASFKSTDNITIDSQPVTSVTLTTTGFIRNADNNNSGMTAPVLTPTAKNRAQYTLDIKTSTLKNNTKLMIVGAMYYNGNYESGVNHWKISDNCLYYVNGECQELDFGFVGA